MDLLLLYILFYCIIFKKINIDTKKSPIHLPIKMVGIYILLLLIIDYYNHSIFDFGSIRRQVNFIMLYYSLLHLINFKNLYKIQNFLISMVSIKSGLNLIQYIGFGGVIGIRGPSTIFWDSGLIYGMGIVCSIYISKFINNIRRVFNLNFILSFISVLLVLLLSFRRNIWLAISIATLIIILKANLSKKIMGVYILFLSILIMTTFINIFPNSSVSVYLNSMNIFSDQTYHIQANKVHFDNVQGYYRMLLDKPEIIFFGRRGIKDSDYKNINKWEDYNLGTPHNAILAKIFYEGIFALLIYLWIHISFYVYCFKHRTKLQEQAKTTIVGIVGFMIGHFILTLLFIPPETTYKGTFFMLFFMITCINLIHYNEKENSSIN